MGPVCVAQDLCTGDRESFRRYPDWCFQADLANLTKWMPIAGTEYFLLTENFFSEDAVFSRWRTEFTNTHFSGSNHIVSSLNSLDKTFHKHSRTVCGSRVVIGLLQQLILVVDV